MMDKHSKVLTNEKTQLDLIEKQGVPLDAENCMWIWNYLKNKLTCKDI